MPKKYNPPEVPSDDSYLKYEYAPEREPTEEELEAILATDARYGRPRLAEELQRRHDLAAGIVAPERPLTDEQLEALHRIDRDYGPLESRERWRRLMALDASPPEPKPKPTKRPHRRSGK